MKLPGPAEWLFSARTFGAAMLALYVGLAMDLDRPYWAMASAYIASQPLSGATRSKAAYRALGTLLGAVAAVVLVPNLVDAPALLSLALAGWVGVCLYFALLDRTPRSYVFMLAGYSAAIIGFPSVAEPGEIFNTALARVEEITLGIGCASIVASVVFPRPVGPVLRMRVAAWRANAQRWCLDALSGTPASAATRAERRRMAADIAEIDLLTSYLAWDPAAQPGAVRTLRALRLRMLMLLPEVSSLADRVRVLQAEGALSPAMARLLADAADWLRAEDVADPAVLARLRTRIAEADPPLDADSTWATLITASLLSRLRAILDLAQDGRTLRHHLASGDGFPVSLAFHRAAGPAEVRHVDHGRAVWSAASAGLAILVCCGFWIASGWPDGAVAAELAAVACCFFAALDDPVPAIVSFLTWSVVAVVIDGVLLFGVLPAAHDFPMLVLALAPAFLVFGTLTATPATATIGMALTANGATLLSLQSTYDATFAPFVNSGLALVVGMGTAAIVTSVVRSAGAEWSAWQLLRRGWVDLARAAERRGSGDRAQFAGLMLDRIGLVAPRMAAVSPGSELQAVDLLAELRVGLNIVSLRRARRALPEPVRGQIDTMLDELALYYRARTRRHALTPPTPLLARVDQALAMVTAAADGRRARDATLGLVGIRRALYPAAAAYAPPPAWREAA